MKALASIAQRFQSVENAIPRRWRLPVRYHGQRLVGGLEPEMALLRQLVKPGGIALDIGANHGVYAYALSKIASIVHCFEPLTECCRYIRDYGSPKITVHNVALSDQGGNLQLYVPIMKGRTVYTRASLDRPPSPCELRNVDVQTLDSFALPHVDFMKIDVEGLEASVLRGGHRTIEAHHPALLVEIDRSRHTMESFMGVHRWLDERGYTAYVCTAGRQAKCVDPWAEGIRHINFIFTRSS